MKYFNTRLVKKYNDLNMKTLEVDPIQRLKNKYYVANIHYGWSKAKIRDQVGGHSCTN